MRRTKAQRGISLIEGLVASIVMLVGLIGVVNGILFAASQNASATKMTRAGAIANQIRAGLTLQGYNGLTDSDGPFSSCTNNSAISGSAYGDLTDGLASVSGYTICTVDVDAYDQGVSSSKPYRKLTPGYVNDGLFKRVLVWMKDATQKTNVVEVVVSWRDAGGFRRYHHQAVAFYNPSTLGGVDQ